MTRIFLAVMAMMFAAFGLWSLLSPLSMTSSLGVDIAGPNGSFEIRGIFGGVSLGASALCMLGALKPDMERPALWFLVAYMGGYCLARGASVMLGDLPTLGTWKFVAFEATSLMLASLALHHRGKASHK